jgi:hypothetical protein
MRIWNVFLIALISSLLFFLSACLEEVTVVTEGGSTAVLDPDLDPESEEVLRRRICDPFGTDSPQQRTKGLHGSLYYLTDDQPRYTSVESYIQNGKRVDADIYLDRLFVKTRPFDRGFTTQAGTQVEFAEQKLYEYFAIDVDSQLQLGADETAGYYQLALLSDDGALLKTFADNGSEITLVNNNGTHPTKMACSSVPVYLDHNTRIPIKIQYYQGPRFHISLVAMWRPWPADGSGVPVQDPLCGQSGNNLFFNPNTNPIQAKTAFYELLERNWKVLENENFEFTEQENNPCVVPEQQLLLSGFSIIAVARNSVTVTWNSNIPASGQIEVKNVNTGVVVFSAVDVNASLIHTMNLGGLSPNTLYSVRTISTSVGGQTVKTDERAFRTPR